MTATPPHDATLRLLACFKAVSGATLTEDDVRQLRSWEGNYGDPLPDNWPDYAAYFRKYALQQLQHEFKCGPQAR